MILNESKKLAIYVDMYSEINGLNKLNAIIIEICTMKFNSNIYLQVIKAYLGD